MGQADKQPEDFRIVIQFPVDPKLFDWFFNARTGYRAHFWAGLDTGLDFNAHIITGIRECLAKMPLFPIHMQKLNIDFDIIGHMDVSKNLIMKSLHEHFAKIWICTKMISHLAPVPCGPVLGVTCARILLDSERSWLQIYNPDNPWLDVKGAFLGLGGPYPPTDPIKRAEKLHIDGHI